MSTSIMAAAFYTSTLAHLAVEITLLVLVLTIIRKRRPEAFVLLATAAGGMIIITLLGTGSSLLAHALAARISPESSPLLVKVVLDACLSILRAGAVAVLVGGIFVLARPGKKENA